MSELRVQARGPLRGEVRVPGDKSISHRAVMLSALAEGATRIQGLLLGEDVRATMAAFQAMGVKIEPDLGTDPEVKIEGRGPAGLRSPPGPLDLGNSGTSMRLLAGLLSGLPLTVTLTGDPSLSRRPMKRVIEPLTQMGAEISATPSGTAPLRIQGRKLRGIRYETPVASAQVKSAILLAGLSASGETQVAEPLPTRDHTERILPAFGVNVKREGNRVGLQGPARLQSPGLIQVPGDISSAAFFIVAALIVDGSHLMIRNVGVNPTRTGLLDILRMMGARIELTNPRHFGGEPAADLTVKSQDLRGVEIGGELIPRAIDEVPALCVAAALAKGRTVIRDARELRVKESDRISGMAAALSKLGVKVEEFPDGLAITGPARLTGAWIDSLGDHRLAMAAAVAGLCASGETVISGAEFIATSFPEFEARLTAAMR